MSEVPFSAFRAGIGRKKSDVDMNEVVGKSDILFICLDTLRYDAASEEEKNGGTPVLNRYGSWEKRQAPGNFTYPSHHAIFAGFLPMRDDARSIGEQAPLFFPVSMGMGRGVPEGSYGFSAPNLVAGLSEAGYDTWCIGGVAFFDKRSEMGRVFPSYFEKSYWNPSFSCTVKESVKNQVDFALKKLENRDDDRHIFMYMNICAIHYPNYFYTEGSKNDTPESHRAALRYTDQELGRLFEGWKEKRGNTFAVCFSDHGTCYGEDGYVFHGVNHPSVLTVPYKHFFL